LIRVNLICKLGKSMEALFYRKILSFYNRYKYNHILKYEYILNLHLNLYYYIIYFNYLFYVIFLFFFFESFLLSFFYLSIFLFANVFLLASLSSNLRAKVKLLLIGCSHWCGVSSNPINANPSRVKRCALPYKKEATVNLGEQLSRAPREGLQTMGRDGKGSRIITVQPPYLYLGTLSNGSFLRSMYVCTCMIICTNIS